MPRTGDVFADARGDDRTMRISRHAESGVVVVSLWAGRLCRASFRLPVSELPRLIATLGPLAGPVDSGATDAAPAVRPAAAAEPDITVTVSQEPGPPPPAWPPPVGLAADSEAS